MTRALREWVSPMRAFVDEGTYRAFAEDHAERLSILIRNASRLIWDQRVHGYQGFVAGERHSGGEKIDARGRPQAQELHTRRPERSNLQTLG